MIEYGLKFNFRPYLYLVKAKIYAKFVLLTARNLTIFL